MSPTIRLAINGTIYQLDAATLLKKRPYLKLSEYLREDLHLTGTKVACGEGGCGGCTVLITRRGPDTRSNHLETVSANACLTPMTSLSNCAITTVEGIYTSDEAATTPPTTTTAESSDLSMYDKLTVPSGNYEPITLANAGPDAALASNVKGRRPHPIQQRFATYNASQCGFCTPGFVMAVCGFLCKQQDYNSSTTTAPSATLQLADIEDAMDGNLCRCTGYRPILEAAAGTAITKLEECHGDRNPDPSCAKCVTCPRAQQCLPDGAHENTLEEARSVLRLVERGFPFMDIRPHSEGTKVPHPTNAANTSLVSPSLPRAPQALAARSNTIIASIANGTSTNTIKTIPVIMGSQESTPPLPSSSMTAFSFHQFPRSIEELTAALISVPSPSLATLVGAQTSAGVYKDHLPIRIMAAAVDKSAPSTIISLMHVNELNTVKQWQLTDDACVIEGLTVGAATTISQLIGHLLYQAMWLLANTAEGEHADASATIVRAAIILKSIAGTHIRDMATIGGNINMCRNLGFASDLATPLCALGATATVLCVNHADKTSTCRTEPLRMYLSIPTSPRHTDVLVSINIPIVSISPNTATTTTRTQGFFHRVATRKANSHAILNGACMITTASNDAAERTITSVSAIFGNTGEMDSNTSNAPKEIPADQIVPLLVGCNLNDRSTVDRFKRGFHVMPGFIEGDYKSAARVQLVKAFIVASLEAAADCGSATTTNTAPIKSYSQIFPSSQGHTASSSTTTTFTEPSVVGRPMSKPDGILHATGTTTYLTDISPPKSTLYMSIVLSTVPSGVIESFGVDALAPLQRLSNKDSYGTTKASNTNGDAVELMVATAEEPTTALILPSDAVDQLTFPMFVGAADLPQWALNRHPDLGGHLGEQDRSGAFPGGYYDFPLVANRLVAYRDQPIGVVIGRTLKEAEMGAKAVAAATTYRQAPSSASSPLPAHLPQVPSILNGKYGDVSVAAIRNHTMKLSEDDDESIKNIVTNEVDFETVLLGQKHFYMENQACLVIPADGATRTKVHLAVHGVQHAAEFVAKSAGYAINQLEVVQHRMGGSFGGKTNVVHACLATIVSRMLNRPVMVSLDRMTDMLFQGGREEMQVRSKVVTTTTTPNNNNNEFLNQYASLSNNAAAGAPRIVSVQTTTHADVGARVGFSNYTLGVVMPYSIMRCYSPTQSINNTAIGYLTQTCERTNVRSPGHAEAAIITEAIVDRVAVAHNIHSQAVREANFLGTDAALTAPYSKTMYSFPGLYKKMMQEGASTQKKNEDGWTSRINSTIEFNKQEEESGGRYRKGAAVVPFEYPVGGGMYTAMVVVLPDGSVVVHHSGVEMGQGLVVKSLQAANLVLSATLDQLCEGTEKQLSSLPMALFQSAGNSSHVLPKHGITGGSTSSEGSVDAVAEAAKKIAEMLEPFVCMLFGSEIDIPEEKAEEIPIAKKGDSDDVFGEYTTLAQATGADTSSISALRALRAQLRRGEFESHTLWCRLVSLANSMGAHLTATAMNSEASGSSSYSIYCVGGAEVTVDTYTGDVVVDRVDIMYDAGRSLNPAVDIGQIEGAFIMGLGYMLTEENAHHDTTTGEEAAGGSTWRYKVPSIRELPSQFNVQLMSPGDLEKWLKEKDANDGKKEAHPTTEDEDNKKVPSCIADKGLVMSSKASGEPPLCIAPCLLSAIRQAVQSSRSSKGLGGFPSISVPYTPDKVLQACGPM